MRFHFPGHHHRRRLPLGERLGSRHPRAGRSHREGGLGSAGRHQLRRPDLLRPAAEPGLGLHPVDRRRGTGAGAGGDRWQNCVPSSARSATSNAEIPIFLHGETRTSRHIPNDILRELHGFIHMFEDTPEFIARNIMREAKAYLDALPPPFFRALTHYAADGSYSWHCPGHSGGVAFLKSPVGQMFHQFFGENMLRADVCNAVEELGQLLDHTGPVAASERNAARIFNCRPPVSSSPTAPRPRTRSSGTPPWRRATSWWSTATATSRSCTRSS